MCIRCDDVVLCIWESTIVLVEMAGTLQVAQYLGSQAWKHRESRVWTLVPLEKGQQSEGGKDRGWRTCLPQAPFPTLSLLCSELPDPANFQVINSSSALESTVWGQEAGEGEAGTYQDLHLLLASLSAVVTSPLQCQHQRDNPSHGSPHSRQAGSWVLLPTDNPPANKRHFLPASLWP